MRGEYTGHYRSNQHTWGSPPLARGIPPSLVSWCPLSGITPACAGNTKALLPGACIIWDHPRLRGEYLSNVGSGVVQAGSPPLARGIPLNAVCGVLGNRITPACAGNTVFKSIAAARSWDHPRLRGEYLKINAMRLKQQGSPPLARGIPQADQQELSAVGITPACAGNTSSEYGGTDVRRDHPRLRGEYNKWQTQLYPLIGSPPLARGIH